MFVKICGITRKEDGLLAAALGAAAVGFVFADSPRRVTVEKAAALSEALPPAVLRVGVFVNPGIDGLIRTIRKTGIDIIQLHGDEPPEVVGEIKKRTGLLVIKAFRVRNEKVDGQPEKYAGKADFFLLDTYDERFKGGTGRGYDRGVIGEIKKMGVPVIAAGGINADNVSRIAADFRPFGVDVSSGVEEQPGVKSADRMKEFFRRLNSGE